MTIDDLKELLKIDLTDTSQDTLLQLIVDSAYDLIENEIKYPLTLKTYTEKKYGKNSKFMSLKYYPINTLTSVKKYNENGDLIADITADIDYQSYREEGLIFNKTGEYFYKAYLYEIQYDIGYSTLPNDLEYALRQVALSMYAQIENVKDGVDRISTPDGTFTYRKELIIPAIETILEKYRRIHL